MSLSSLPLSYCTNVHPARTVRDVEQGLRRFTSPMQRRLQQPVAAGLWLAASVVGELTEDHAAVDRLRGTLEDLGLTCYTLNTFPYGDFHSPRVKQNVYVPDWTDPRRLQYTQDCAAVLSKLIPPGVEGSLSTVPLGFKEFPESQRPSHRAECIKQLLRLAQDLDATAQQGGPVIRLAIEPEPYCLLETTTETLSFFEDLFAVADQLGLGSVAREYLGVCYDVCHQAIEFEDVATSIRDLESAGVRINKIHITCAIHLDHPAENETGRKALEHYVEERYLHQTMARTADGRVLRQVDLSTSLANDPPADFLNAEAWRVHFHVPVHLETLGSGLTTTQPELRQALAAVADLAGTPHLEVETYTWPVLPDRLEDDPDERLIRGLTDEMRSARSLLDSMGEDRVS